MPADNVSFPGLDAKVFHKVLTGTAVSIDTGANGIPPGYDVLEIFIISRTDEAVTSSTATSLRLNGDSGSNYDRYHLRVSNNAITQSELFGGTSFAIRMPGASHDANIFGYVRITIPFYSQTVAHKSVEWTLGVMDDADTADIFHDSTSGRWRSTSAINRITWETPGTYNFIAGSSMVIFAR